MKPTSPWFLLLALAGVLAFAAEASADPRWWWSDLRLTDNPQPSITPHIVAPGYSTGGGGQGRIFVTWSEVDPRGGDLEIWAKASYDGGCTWCAATRLTDNAVDDTNPRIAVLVLPTQRYSFAVAFESNSQVVIAWDSDVVAANVPFEENCSQFAELGPAIILNGQYERFGEPGSVADHPDVVSASTFSFGHFHATWRDTRGGSSAVYHARDLTAFGGAGWRLSPPRDLSALAPGGMGEDSAPVIAGDIATDPDPVSGINTSDRSAPTVAFVHVAPTDEVSVHVLRSVDSGDTFSPSGARLDAPSEPVSDAAAPADEVRHLAIDAVGGFSTSDPAWVALTFEDTRGVEGPDLGCDARYHPVPATALPDWQSPDDRVTVTDQRGGSATEPSLALQRAFGQPVPAWVAWEDPRFGPLEVAVRGGLLDLAVADVIDFSRYPIPAVRALDPVVSTEVQLTHCKFDERTFDCVPDRVLGVAEDVELSGNEEAVFAVWADTRDGNSEIYFKRTDRFVGMSAATLTTDCDPAGGAQLHVTFTPVASCPQPFAGERMLRYLVYLGTDVGGPFANAAAPRVVLHDPLAGPTVTVTFRGLPEAVPHQVIVVPEDEARNVYPGTFDPLADLAATWDNEVSLVTAAPCAVPDPCLYRFDVTGLLPHDPARADVYLVPPSPQDISLRTGPYVCPFASGDLEPDVLAATNGIALVLYQVDRPVGTLRVAREGDRLRFTF